jgi:hypothetical protein
MYGTETVRKTGTSHTWSNLNNVQRILLEMKAIHLFCLRPEADSWVLPPQTPEAAPPLNNKKNISFRQGCGSGSAYLGKLGPDPRRRQNSEAVQAQNGEVEGLKTIGHRNTLMKSRISITIHIQVKSLIRIRFTGMRIHNPDFRYLNTGTYWLLKQNKTTAERWIDRVPHTDSV